MVTEIECPNCGNTAEGDRNNPEKFLWYDDGDGYWDVKCSRCGEWQTIVTGELER